MIKHKTADYGLYIVEASVDDVLALSQLLNTLFTIEQDFNPDQTKQINGLNQIIASPETAVIKVAKLASGEIVGMVSAQLVISTAQGTFSAWVEDMVIAEAYRAQGIGRKLLEAVLGWAKQKGATRAQLLVDLDNEPALGYYQHLGWESSRMGMRRLYIL